jgi:hypothetical protein
VALHGRCWEIACYVLQTWLFVASWAVHLVVKMEYHFTVAVSYSNSGGLNAIAV